MWHVEWVGRRAGGRTNVSMCVQDAERPGKDGRREQMEVKVKYE